MNHPESTETRKRKMAQQDTIKEVPVGKHSRLSRAWSWLGFQKGYNVPLCESFPYEPRKLFANDVKS